MSGPLEITAAITSTTSLGKTVDQLKGRDPTLRRLRKELENLSMVLKNLSELVGLKDLQKLTDLETSIIPLLQALVTQCSQLCSGFESSMITFGKTKTDGIRDWKNMEFMGGDPYGFMDILYAFKSTFLVGIGMINRRTSKVTQEVLEELNEKILDAEHDLIIEIQRTGEKMKLAAPSGSQSAIGFQDVEAVFKQCLSICEIEKFRLESFTDEKGSLTRQPLPVIVADGQHKFDAWALTRETLYKNRNIICTTIVGLQGRLESLAQNGAPEVEGERQQVQHYLGILSKVLSKVIMASSEIPGQEDDRIGETTADVERNQNSYL
ncbi:hypothetical protein ColTof3_08543 [Colletotrichum tofieldiae]|nr:hypothetical protein ColTof3_08543 [Colletotrichum tofieldiae]